MSQKDISGSSFRCSGVFEDIAALMAADGKNLVDKVKGIFVFNVTHGPEGAKGVWVVDAKNGQGSVEFVNNDIPTVSDVIINIKDADLLDLMAGKLNAQKAFFTGKIKVKGNVGLALKLNVFRSKPKSKL